MELDSAAAFVLGATAGAAAGAVALAGLVRALRREGRLAPVGLMKATALRFGLTLAAALAIALALERESALKALAGLSVSYVVLLVVETRWALTRARGEAAGSGAVAQERRPDVGQ